MSCVYLRVVWYFNMKFTVLILLTLVQFGLLGQPSEWNQTTVKNNRVKEVLVYTKVPKTNPDYFKKPRGLMLISETRFDNFGRVTLHNCKGCYQITDTDSDCCTDVIQKFFYDKKKLARIEEMDFHKSTTIFSYDTVNRRRLVIGIDRNDKRSNVKLEYFDQKGREVSAIELDFGSTFTKGDTIFQVFITKLASTYDRLAKTIEESGGCFWKNMDRLKFKVFTSSTDINEIENTFKSLDLSFIEPRGKWTISYDENGNEIEIADRNDEKFLTTYIRTKKGLITKEIIKKPAFTFEHVYHYKYWN
jgi:hypothetical protein